MTGGRLRDRFGEWDDRSVSAGADDPHRGRWGRWALADLIGSMIAVVLIAGCSALLGEAVGGAVAIVIAIAFTAAYVVWRRLRNRRLTGSPTRWPRS